MSAGVTALSEREKQVLRLLLYGHDAKSISRELDLSVHTVNDHLREARRKLGVSNSREAARVLAAAEPGGPESFAGKKFGIGEAPGLRAYRLNWIAGGMLIMSLLVAAAALTFAFHPSSTLGAVPKVIATSPQPGETIKPGSFVLSVTYDRPMREQAYSFAGELVLAPDNCGDVKQSKDGRTYSERCHASAGRHYEIWFNRPPYMHFQSQEGVPAQPYRLVFNVSR
jgi:DNA-binding CsgD family transcriptional regulator